jgi:cysteinyl-tRNA synthetase
MALRVYNTLTRRKEDFEPLRPPRVNMFVCGITPYDRPHVGHAKTYVAFDVVARYLRYKGYRVFYVQNVTDVEDRLIERMHESGRSWRDLVDEFLDEYFDAMRALNVTSVNLYAHATDYMPEIVAQIEGLIAKGHAYVVDGDVFYAVDTFDGWGKLSGQKVEEHLPGARVAVDERKRNPADFALWKGKKPGEPAWDSPWGEGRPGWHIEDTAITVAHFGPRYDIHGGATELMFPHHEAEIAQAEALTGVRPFVRYWMHGGLLNMKGEKMSKSLGNIVSVGDVLARYDPMVLRFYYLYAHYRSPIDWSEEQLEEAKRGYGRLRETLANLRAALRDAGEKGPGDDALRKATRDARTTFEARMDDDFNTREALSAVFDFAREVNKALDSGAGREALREAEGAFAAFDEVLGVFGPQARVEGDRLARVLDLIVELREEARARKDYATSDRIRARLADAGVVLEDTKDGVRWKLR